MTSKKLRKKIRSTREKVRADRALFEEAQKALQAIDTAKLDERIAALTIELTSLDALIAHEQRLYNLLNRSTARQSAKDAALAALNDYKAQRDVLSSQLATLNEESVNSKKNNDTTGANDATDNNTDASGDAGSTVTVSNQKTGGLEYNASGVRETHFSTRADFQRRLMSSPNAPRAVRVASQLWTTSQASKGMIVTSEQVLKAWNTGSNPLPGGVKNYGFQFQYNPGTVGMNYFTSPNVDVTLMTSGQEKFNLAGTSGSQGSISFQIVINRIFDMQYYTAAGYIAPKFDPRKLYAKPPGTKKEEKMLHDKGTMYDVEYLLRTLMGTTMKSYLRGEDTADMGWLPAIPVELHLGKNLRYLGTINSVSLNHIIFNEKMVPLFTTMDIQFTRLPDYPAN